MQLAPKPEESEDSDRLNVIVATGTASPDLSSPSRGERGFGSVTDPALEVFRSEVRDFCERELPAETKRKNLEGQHIGRDELGVWMQRLSARG